LATPEIICGWSIGCAPPLGGPRPPSFFQTFPKKCGSNAKLFQRIRWWFCGISRGCNRSKPKNRFQTLVLQTRRQESALRAQTESGLVGGHRNKVCTAFDFPEEILTLSIRTEGASEEIGSYQHTRSGNSRRIRRNSEIDSGSARGRQLRTPNRSGDNSVLVLYSYLKLLERLCER
jgi:hypothetical protein